MRLAGTCSRYSKSAMPQLAIAATHHTRSFRLRRCAYQANVMKTLEAMRRSVVCATTGSDAIVLRFGRRVEQLDALVGDAGEEVARRPVARDDDVRREVE